MTATANPAQGTWPVGTVPFATKYGVLNNLSTSSPRGTVFDPYTSPDALFINNEQGVWYDPSDFSTMWQDAAATTPVTAVEQPVGKILDKSGRGNHATQATSASRPVLSARVNLLAYSENFSNAIWPITTGATKTSNGVGSYTFKAGSVAFGVSLPQSGKVVVGV